jgi:hypothetical protein
MADPMTAPAPRCQWCSAVLPAADLATCPSCGATLTASSATDDIKGVTTLDPEAILRARTESARPRGRLLSFITGEQPVDVGGPEEAESLAPPDEAVRLEMRRLELEAERADLEAETVALKTDVVVEQNIDLASLGGSTDEANGTTDATADDAGAASPPDDAAAGSTRSASATPTAEPSPTPPGPPSA